MDWQFWCTECGTNRDVLDAVAKIKGGCGLCRYCNQQLEVELGRGARESPPTRKRKHPPKNN